MIKIAFTGHRNKVANDCDLAEISAKYPNAVWIHGGAKGFDSQVARFARSHEISECVILPDYEKYHPKKAPLIRNEEIISQANVLIACYDGRKSGGTYYTIRKAREKGIPVFTLVPIQE